MIKLYQLQAQLNFQHLMEYQHHKDMLKLNNEIIYYNSVGTNQLGIGTRGVDGYNSLELICK